MSVQVAAAILWGHAGGLAINLLFIHSTRVALVATMLAVVFLIGAVLIDEWRHPASAGYWTTTYR